MLRIKCITNFNQKKLINHATCLFKKENLMKNINPKLNIANTIANNCDIAGIYENIDENFKKQLKENLLSPKPLLVCSGGTSSRCAAKSHWSLDLRKNFSFINTIIEKDQVEIGAGIKMGELVKILSKYKRSFPIGLSGETGLGYILTGGISPLSRSEGLAIDKIISIEGIWGNGNSFKISKPKKNETSQRKLQWKGLCGAAPFFAIVTKLKTEINYQEPLSILEPKVLPNQLTEIIKFAEDCSIYSSFQWIWNKGIKVYGVFKVNREEGKSDLNSFNNRFSYLTKNTTSIIGISEMPPFSNSHRNNKTLVFSEVLGLLGPAWTNNHEKIIAILNELINNRPHPMCSIAAQQLGGYVNTNKTTSFIHRDSMWKPWITASWEENDNRGKELSLKWLKNS